MIPDKLLRFTEHISLLAETGRIPFRDLWRVTMRMMCKSMESEVAAMMWERQAGELRRGEWIMRSTINFL